MFDKCEGMVSEDTDGVLICWTDEMSVHEILVWNLAVSYSDAIDIYFDGGWRKATIRSMLGVAERTLGTGRVL